jgi:acetylornithine deacetylase/succinyl-diaminopimelate desuccinylase-like protein
MPQDSLTEKAINHARDNQEETLNDLYEFLRIPSVSTQPERADDVAAAAQWCADAMQRAGLDDVEVIPTPRHPLVFGQWLGAGIDRPTVLIYGHYDVQPEEPIDLWETPPFEPTRRGDYIYARGATDDKGQLLVHLKAVQSLMAVSGSLPVNVKFLLEGEEEIGGMSLEAFIPSNLAKLRADVVLISDTPMLGLGQPSIVYGLRGICYMMMDLTGPSRDLHSGAFGGGINNPLNALGRVIAGLQDDQGHILIPGFYDKVRSLSQEERELLAETAIDEAAWLADTGAPDVWGEPEYTLVERIGARPSLDVHGIVGGYTGVGAKTVLPSTVHAKISMRLVPDQQPEEIADLFTAHVRALLPPTITANIVYNSGARASISDYNTEAMRAVRSAYAEVFGKTPVLSREGGSIPVVGALQTQLGVETVLMGFGLPDDRAHAPNERFYLPNLYQGIETAIRFLTTYGGDRNQKGL